MAVKTFNISHAEADSTNVAVLNFNAEFEGIGNYAEALRRLFYLKYLSNPKEELLSALQVVPHIGSLGQAWCLCPPTWRLLSGSSLFQFAEECAVVSRGPVQIHNS